MFRKFLQTTVAGALIAAPLSAHAAPERFPAPTDGESEQIVGLLWQYVLFPVIVAAVIAAVSGGEDDEEPASP